MRCIKCYLEIRQPQLLLTLNKMMEKSLYLDCCYRTRSHGFPHHYCYCHYHFLQITKNSRLHSAIWLRVIYPVVGSCINAPIIMLTKELKSYCSCGNLVWKNRLWMQLQCLSSSRSVKLPFYFSQMGHSQYFSKPLAVSPVNQWWFSSYHIEFQSYLCVLLETWFESSSRWTTIATMSSACLLLF